MEKLEHVDQILAHEGAKCFLVFPFSWGLAGVIHSPLVPTLSLPGFFPTLMPWTKCSAEGPARWHRDIDDKFFSYILTPLLIIH